MYPQATKAFLEAFGSKGASLMIRQVVQDWQDLEVNAELVEKNEIGPASTCKEILTRLLPMLEAMLNENANTM